MNEFNFDNNVRDLCDNYLPVVDGFHYEFDSSEDKYGYPCADINLVTDDQLMIQYVGTISAWNSGTDEVYDTSSEQWKINCLDHLEDCIQSMKLL